MIMVLLWLMTLLYLFVSTDLTLAQWSPVDGSQSFTFTITKAVPGVIINWILQNGNTNSSLFICGALSSNCIRENYVDDLYSANITSNSSSYISVLTIKSILPSPYERRLLCIANLDKGLSESVWYDINTFAVAESPTCDDVTLQNEIEIQINCWTQKVFPDSICIFYIITNASKEHALSAGNVVYTTDHNVYSGYYQTNCTLTVTAASIGPGSHIFRVVMYPNITEAITDDMKTSSNYTKAINLNYPNALLGADCHVQDYVKEFQATTCTCYDNNTVFLPTLVTWSTGVSKNRTLTFYPDRNTIADMNFQCTASNVLGFKDTILYLPTVAYPPSVSLSLPNTNFDLCVDKNINITGRCNVSDGYPVSTVSIYINNDLLDTKYIYNSSQHEFSTTYTSSGVVNVTCLADNVAFSISRTQYIYITGPPEAPKLLTLLRQESVSSLDKTRPATIMCQSKGGYPSKKRLTLTCDSMVGEARDSDSISLEVTMTPNSIDVNCTCDVWHESKCLLNKTSGMLRLCNTIVAIESPSEINSAAIAIGVILGLCVLGLTVAIIFIVRRNKRHKGCNPLQGNEKTQSRKEYNSVKAIAYVNTEQHGYETAKDNPSYINDTLYTSGPPTNAVNEDVDYLEVIAEDGTYHEAETEDDTYNYLDDLQ